MRSFFNKPSWASRGDETQDVKFYRHASQVYNDIVSANRDALRANHTQATRLKRRRTSNENHGDDTLSVRTCKGYEAAGDCQISSYNSVDQCKSAQESEDDLDYHVPDAPQHEPRFDDEYGFNHTKLRIAVKPRDEVVATGTTAANDMGGSRSAHMDTSQSSNMPSPTEPTMTISTHIPSSDDATVQILITSSINHTKPLIVRRKMHQPLKDVRLAWFNRQALPKELQSSIFLTWKGKRLFDVTTCRSLGIGAKGGHAYGTDVYGFPRNDCPDLQVHMEATTENCLDLNVDNTLPFANLEQNLGSAAGEPSLNSLVFKSPGIDDLRLKVSPQLQVSQLICLYREARQIPQEHDVYLIFDGERLESDHVLAEYDLENDDLLDVIVK
ncbi:small ubiquitin-related modifier domain-containing protein [Aspergillus homomorphus CBS 101889]|uniref:Ubiquitin-like domain-containing protein n=1 Tax=Aspergillus homomorphus (strain CBS 101889) TaxID=1450537 RepID=A0A395HM61_ASPHC|nr:hypothetical protein BO97DRAFT_199389 [Aspergillus homomorphus CBS 101889]RAL08706.1 hypothetical protein BO97DRAFT_199389 [Aspergillus homomorphus CBS 101889]